MRRLLLRFVLVFGGIGAVIVLVQRFGYFGPIFFYFLIWGGFPLLLLLVILAALYQRPRDR